MPKKTKIYLIIFISFLIWPSLVFAADAVTLPKYITSLYSIGLILAGVTAMIMLIYAGYQYMIGGINANTISQAKDTATNALLGLVLLISSGLILRTIDPAFLEFSWQGFDFEGKLDWIKSRNADPSSIDGTKTQSLEFTKENECTGGEWQFIEKNPIRNSYWECVVNPSSDAEYVNYGTQMSVREYSTEHKGCGAPGEKGHWEFCKITAQNYQYVCLKFNGNCN